jgi:hypothetical protein
MDSLSRMLTEHRFVRWDTANAGFTFSGPGVCVLAEENSDGSFHPIEVRQGNDALTEAKSMLAKRESRSWVVLIAKVSEDRAKRVVLAHAIQRHIG